MQSPQFPRYLIPSRSKYSSQHHILKHPQLPFLPQYQRPSFTPILNNRQNYVSMSLNAGCSQIIKKTLSPNLNLCDFSYVNIFLKIMCFNAISHPAAQQGFSPSPDTAEWNFTSTIPRVISYRICSSFNVTLNVHAMHTIIFFIFHGNSSAITHEYL